MKTTKTVMVERQKIISIVCDVCKKKYDDILDTQEFLIIDEHGGYYSAIGDGAHYTCDICSKCVKELLGQYLNVKPQKDG